MVCRLLILTVFLWCSLALEMPIFAQNLGDRDAGYSSSAERAVRMSGQSGGYAGMAERASRLRSRGRFSNMDAITLPMNKPERPRVPITREWFNKGGEKIVDGLFVSYQSGDVVLRGLNGRQLIYPVVDLSRQCKAYVNFQVNGLRSVREPALLIEVLLNHDNRLVREAKARQLGNVGPSNRELVIQALEQALEDEDLIVIMAAIESMVRLEAESLLPRLDEFIDGDDEELMLLASRVKRRLVGESEDAGDVNQLDREAVTDHNNKIQERVQVWIQEKSGDPANRALYTRHYGSLLRLRQAFSEAVGMPPAMVDASDLIESLAQVVRMPDGWLLTAANVRDEDQAAFNVEAVRSAAMEPFVGPATSVLLYQAGARDYQVIVDGQSVAFDVALLRLVEGILKGEVSHAGFPGRVGRRPAKSRPLADVIAGRKPLAGLAAVNETVDREIQLGTLDANLLEFHSRLLLLREVIIAQPAEK